MKIFSTMKIGRKWFIMSRHLKRLMHVLKDKLTS